MLVVPEELDVLVLGPMAVLVEAALYPLCRPDPVFATPAAEPHQFRALIYIYIFFFVSISLVSRRGMPCRRNTPARGKQPP